jgi:hypothetical protein
MKAVMLRMVMGFKLTEQELAELGPRFDALKAELR